MVPVPIARKRELLLRDRAYTNLLKIVGTKQYDVTGLSIVSWGRQKLVIYTHNRGYRETCLLDVALVTGANVDAIDSPVSVVHS